MDLTNIDILNVLSVSLLTLFLLEQIFFYTFPGSFIYRAGIPIKRIIVPVTDKTYWVSVLGYSASMRGKFDEKRDELYVRNRHFPLTWGPLFFVGQLKINDPGTLIVRVGPVTAMLLIGLIVDSIIFAGINGIFSAVLIALFIMWMYRRFIRMVNKYWTV